MVHEWRIACEEQGGQRSRFLSGSVASHSGALGCRTAESPCARIDQEEEEQVSTAQETSNKATIRRFAEAVNSGDVEFASQAFDEIFDPDVKQHSPFEVTGVQALKETVFERLYRAFPDLHLELRDLIEEGDKIVEMDTVTGTNLGEFNGLPPTGRSVSYSEIFIMRFAEGRIAEIWGVVDIFTAMKQLGVIPA